MATFSDAVKKLQQRGPMSLAQIGAALWGKMTPEERQRAAAKILGRMRARGMVREEEGKWHLVAQ